MAKLSARGRTELARYTLTESSVGESAKKIRTTYAVMSDTAILRKTDWLKEDGKLDHSGSWKFVARTKDPTLFGQGLIAKGFKQEAQ
mgnify:CR=1 FL=1